MRESTVRGPAVDLGEFERRLRGPERTGQGKADPLSELARLMEGREAAETDPYSQILADPRAARAPAPPPVEPSWDAPQHGLRGSYDEAPAIAPEPRHYADAAHGEQAYHDAVYQQEHAYHQQAPAPAYPDQYGTPYSGAEGGWSDDSQYLDYGADEEPQYEEERGGWRRHLRPWHAIAAISVLAIGSIGWGFAHRSGGGSRDIAVINAPEGPVKVKPSAETEQGAPDAGTAAVLDRKETAPVKQVVNNREQAVDPTVAPRTVKLGSGPVDAPHEPALAPTQPRKVKTVTVRPDGTRVEDAALPPAVAKVTSPPPSADAAKTGGGTPKTTSAKTTTTAATAQAAKPKPPVKTAAVEEPPASEPDSAAAAVSGGGYAVQFGAAGSEAEARALLKTVAAKYGAQLGGRKPTFKPAQVGDKTVYRVRVGGVSKDSANAICSKVKASGGSCFVAGN